MQVGSLFWNLTQLVRDLLAFGGLACVLMAPTWAPGYIMGALLMLGNLVFFKHLLQRLQGEGQKQQWAVLGLLPLKLLLVLAILGLLIQALKVHPVGLVLGLGTQIIALSWAALLPPTLPGKTTGEQRAATR